MNIMDESFLNQLGWDENGILDASVIKPAVDPSPDIKMEQEATLMSSSANIMTNQPPSPLISSSSRSAANVSIENVRVKTDPIPTPVTGKIVKTPPQYQLIKPGPAPKPATPQSAPNVKISSISTTSTPLILTQNRSNIITTTPSTILLSSSNFYNLKGVPITGTPQQITAIPSSTINIKPQQNSKTKISNTVTTQAQAVPIVQPILTFQTTDQKPVLLQTGNVMYTTASNDPTRTVSNFYILFRTTFNGLI